MYYVCTTHHASIEVRAALIGIIRLLFRGLFATRPLPVRPYPGNLARTIEKVSPIYRLSRAEVAAPSYAIPTIRRSTRIYASQSEYRLTVTVLRCWTAEHATGNVTRRARLGRGISGRASGLTCLGDTEFLMFNVINAPSAGLKIGFKILHFLIYLLFVVKIVYLICLLLFYN